MGRVSLEIHKNVHTKQFIEWPDHLTLEVDSSNIHYPSPWFRPPDELSAASGGKGRSREVNGGQQAGSGDQFVADGTRLVDGMCLGRQAGGGRPKGGVSEMHFIVAAFPGGDILYYYVREASESTLILGVILAPTASALWAAGRYCASWPLLYIYI